MKKILLTLALITSSVFATISSDSYRNIALGILANGGIAIDADSVEIIDVEPLPNNETVLQISFKNKNTNTVNVVYALDHDTVLIGQLYKNGKIQKQFFEASTLKAPLNKIDSELLELIKKESIKAYDEKKPKSDIYIVTNIISNDFQNIIEKFDLINEQFNAHYLFINYDATTLLKTISLNSAKIITDKTLKDIFLKNQKTTITTEQIKKTNDIKTAFFNTKTLNSDEKIGNIAIVIMDDKRIDLDIALMTDIMKNVRNKKEKK